VATTVHCFQITQAPSRQPSNETGIYLRQHKHRWIETGTHTWPVGTVDPVFTCSICRDVICCAALPAAPNQEVLQ